ncbi:divalent-cation tolerance protein CutA [bacterium DOLJORAL78_65_58]|nr:MAG: divalent-cation tolerance protein CutA [bacterium DOLZORAL124_64_63]PIE75980.1 MAG: divalent-cation tolerance protein CutA [bacterium DOLJORAL78_65_58]
MNGPLLILTTTFDSTEKAEEVAAAMVDHGLAVCAQVDGPMRSFYRWQGQLQRDSEVRVTFKVLPDRFELFCGELRLQHPYDVPQMTAWPAAWVDPRYLDWALGKDTGEGS